MTNQAVGPMVRDAVARAGIVDMHTHLYHEGFGSLLLWGIDELVTYHYLVAEFHRVRPDVPPAAFARLPKREQADRIWSELFIKRSPVSEAGRGVVTTLERLGLDPAERDLDRARAHFRTVKLSRHIDRVFEAAGLEYVVMTNDPFDAQEAVCWKRGKRRDERFKAALRIDGLLMGWKTVLPDLRAQGYDVDKALTKKTLAAMGQFLEDWFEIMDPLYLAASLPPEIAYPAFDDFTVLLDEVVLPLCRRKRVPFAAMIGVRKLTNPELGVAGDTVGAMDIRVSRPWPRATPRTASWSPSCRAKTSTNSASRRANSPTSWCSGAGGTSTIRASSAR